MIFVGDDWAEAHHDVWIMDESGDKLAYRRLPEGIEGIAAFHELVAGHVTDPCDVAVGIETDRGLWVHALVAAGYQVYAINPLSASRYRDRHRVSGAKADRTDAKMLSDLVRTDRRAHRQVAGDTPEAGAIQVVARAHQQLIWERGRHTNRLRSVLREYYPAALQAFSSLADRDALAILAIAPSPTEASRLTLAQIRAALKKQGRRRNLGQRADEIRQALQADHLQAPDPVAVAFGATTRSAISIISEIQTQITEIETTLTEALGQHPDAAIYLSMPGLADVLGARILGEFGDDPNRYATAKSRRNYAATSPLTISSGINRRVIARYVRNDRLYDASIRWAFASITTSPGCRIYYDEQRAKGDSHYKALRALANRLVGIVHGCLKHRTTYNEETAWAHRQPATPAIAA